MRHLLNHGSLVVMALFLFPITTNATTATLRHGMAVPTYYPGGYNGAADNTIFYYAPFSGSGHPAEPEVWMRSSDGISNALRSNTGGRGSAHSLRRFDLSAMSGQGVHVTGNATLTLTSAGGSTTADYGLYQIAPANAGWTESTINCLLFPTNTNPAYQNKSNQGDPTWFYKSIDNATYAATTGWQTTAAQDTTSVKWASEQTSIGNPGSDPESYANTGGLWNWIDLVDQDPSTVADSYLNMPTNMDPVDSEPFPILLGTANFTIPAAMIQSWIDNPGQNAGLLGRYMTTSGTTGDFYSKEWGTTPERRPTLTFEFELTPVGVPGDYNGNGTVDAADYVLWRNGGPLQNEVDTPGVVNAADYTAWQARFGNTSGSGSLAISAVPEPASATIACAAFVGGWLLARRKK
ncbi:MAG: hypothetical protein IT427_16585 [Pirellulales bacterium]|nr:hypothetical protein [Pirellulales bacterium]